jgi:hypothetical protein
MRILTGRLSLPPLRFLTVYVNHADCFSIQIGLGRINLNICQSRHSHAEPLIDPVIADADETINRILNPSPSPSREIHARCKESELLALDGDKQRNGSLVP